MRVDRLPSPGETVSGHDLRHDQGGKGANQAVAAARLGAETAMIGCVGDDEAGTGATSALAGEGIDVSGLTVAAGHPTGQAFISVDSLGENSIVVVDGANGLLTPDRVRLESARIASAGVLLCQLEVPISAVTAAAELAKGIVVLNPAPARQLPHDLLTRADVVVPNAGELATLAGAEALPTTIDEITALVRLAGLDRAVVTLGARGALVVDGDRSLMIEAVPVDVVDTTAAGDAFCGALAVALSEGRSLEDAARWAAAAGAGAASVRGAQASLPNRSRVDRLAGLA